MIGHSLGGHNAIFTALFDRRLKAVVSSCGFNAFPDYYHNGNIAGWSHKGYMPRLRDQYQLDPTRVPFDFPELIAAPVPAGVSSPTRRCTTLILRSTGVRKCIAAMLRPVYELYCAGLTAWLPVYPDAEHSFPKVERQRAYRFLDDALRSTR